MKLLAKNIFGISFLFIGIKKKKAINEAELRGHPRVHNLGEGQRDACQQLSFTVSDVQGLYNAMLLVISLFPALLVILHL